MRSNGRASQGDEMVSLFMTDQMARWLTDSDLIHSLVDPVSGITISIPLIPFIPVSLSLLIFFS
jgi:hypothetical protein